MAPRARAPRHGGAAEFDRLTRRVLAAALRSGSTISVVEVHHWRLRVSAKFHVHATAAEVAAPNGRSDRGRRRDSAPSSAPPRTRDEGPREPRGPNSRQRRSMARTQAYQARCAREERERRAAAVVASPPAPRVSSEFNFAADDPKFAFGAAALAGAGTVVVASAAAPLPGPRVGGIKRLLEEEEKEDEEDYIVRFCDGVRPHRRVVGRGVAAGSAGGAPPAPT